MKFLYKFAAFAILIILLYSLNIANVNAGGTVTNCTDDSQFSSMLGGGGTVTFNCGNATVVLSSTKTIAANTTIDGGGKITLSGDSTYRHFIVSNGVTLTLQNITLSGGKVVGDGGSVYNNGTLNVTNTTFFNNETDTAHSGGAIVSYGTLNVTNSTFNSNKGGSGGAIYPRWGGAITTIHHSSFVQNETINDPNGLGGALLIWDGASVTIEDSTFNANKAFNGGAIFNTANSTLNIKRSSLMSHQILGSVGTGGAIYNSGSTTISDSTFSNNNAFHGGALMNYGPTLDITNSTFYANRVGGYGNMLYNYNGNSTLTNVTIVSDGGGTSYGQIVHYGSNNSQRVRLKNTIFDVSDSVPNPQASCYNDPGSVSTIISDGFNLFTDGGCGNLQLTDKVNTPSLLGTLANNGGTTQTFLPQANSQALNNGTPSGAPTTDQRGITRPQSGAFDIGAVERCPKPGKPTLVSPANGARVGKSPKLDWSDAACFARYDLQVRQDSKKGTIVTNLSALTASQYKVKGLTHGKTYFWRATAKNEGGSKKSAWGMFTVK